MDTRSTLHSSWQRLPWLSLAAESFLSTTCWDFRRTKVPVRRNMNVAKTSAPTSDSADGEFVKKAFLNASRMMKDSGFGLNSEVKIAIDPKLPFMGYSMPLGKGYRIVVSGGSVGSGMLEGQIVHEMLNDIQDLYADDISMKVLKKNQILESDQISSFLQDWVKDEPIESGDQKRDRWVNASIMVHNARALGQMTRHGIKDTGGKAAESNRKFLSRMPPTASSQFPFFQDLMINLKENVTRDQYRKLLADYLNRFVEVAEKN